MTAEEAREEIRRLAHQYRVRFTPHGWDEMENAGAGVDDVRCALINSTECVHSGEGKYGSDKWKVTGPDMDGDKLVVVVVIEGDVVVITVM